MNAIVPLGEMERMAAAIAKSGLFGMKTPEQALALMVVAQSEGRHPGSIASEYHIIQGRPALKSDAMLARFQQAGGKVEWTAYTDEKVAATFSHPQGGSVTVDWDMARAHAAKLTGKDNWKAYPRAMLRARVISEGIRTCYPAVCVGVYSVEETQDFSPGERDITPSGTITPTTGAMAALPIKEQEAVIEMAQQIKAYIENDQLADAFALWQSTLQDADFHVPLQSLLDSKQRGILTRMAQEERAHAEGTISPQAKKRLEARIKELNVDREKVKAFCSDNFDKQHFSELTRQEYETLDAMLTNMAIAQTESAPPPVASPDVAALPPQASGADLSERDRSLVGARQQETEALSRSTPSPSPHARLQAALKVVPKVLANRLFAQMAAKGVKNDETMTDKQADTAIAWLNAQVDKQAAA